MKGVTLAVTASRRNPTTAQALALARFMRWVELAPGKPTLVHGNCVGGDEATARFAAASGWTVVARLGDQPRWQATGVPNDVVFPPEPSRARSRKVVQDGDVLVAMPKETVEPKPGRGQGTWTAVRDGRDRLNKPVVIIWPDGRMEAT